MSIRLAVCGVLAVALAGCAGEKWPEPPPVDQAQYQKNYQTWLDEQQETARASTKEVGIWPLQEGETPFGSDASLPIVLPAGVAPTRAGIFSRKGDMVTVTPARGVVLEVGDGGPVKTATVAEGQIVVGSLRMFVFPMGDGRQFVSASDEEHPLLKTLPSVQTYPVDMRWRVAARFDAFDAPKMMPVADVRGGTTEYPAVGYLTFRIGDREQRLIAWGSEGRDDFFVMFKDATNASTTYGARMLNPPVVAKGEWTVLDFNVARNPPCAYSQFTTCPLPPAENRLAVAIEAGEKRFPTGRGFVQQ